MKSTVSMNIKFRNLVFITFIFIFSACEKEEEKRPAWMYNTGGEFCTYLPNTEKWNEPNYYTTCEDCELNNVIKPIHIKCTSSSNGGGGGTASETKIKTVFVLRNSSTCTSICASDWPTGNRLRLKIYAGRLQLSNGCNGECINSGNLVFDDYIFSPYNQSTRFGSSSEGSCESQTSATAEFIYLEDDVYRYCWEVTAGSSTISVGSFQGKKGGDCVLQLVYVPTYFGSC